MHTALPIISHILINNLTNIDITISTIASFKALNSAPSISEISGTHPNGFTSFGKVISSIFLQNGSSKSRINSKTPGLNKGGRGQSIDKSAFEINLAPGNLFNWSTKSSKLSA